MKKSQVQRASTDGMPDGVPEDVLNAMDTLKESEATPEGEVLSNWWSIMIANLRVQAEANYQCRISKKESDLNNAIVVRCNFFA